MDPLHIYMHPLHVTESEFQELEARAAKLVEALHASSFVEEIGAVVPYCQHAWHMTGI